MIDEADDLRDDMRSTDPTMKQREMAAGFDQQISASPTRDRSAQRVGGTCLTRRSDIVFCSFHCHERGRANRVEINFVASKKHIAPNEISIVEDAANSFQDKLRWKIHQRQCES